MRYRRLFVAVVMALIATAFGPVLAQTSAQTPAPAPAPAAEQDWGGLWHGSLQVRARQLRLQLHIAKQSDGSLRGELESLDQAPGQALQLDSLDVAGGRLRFALSARGIRYEGNWHPEAQGFRGRFQQGQAVLPLSFARGGFLATMAIPGLDGHWDGVTRRNSAEMHMALRVTTGAQGTRAALDAPDMLAKNLAVADLVLEGAQLRFSLPSAGVSFIGQLDGDRFSGRWSDGAESHFLRSSMLGSAPAPRRPQTPQPPFPYREIETRIPNPQAPDVVLAATLSLPAGRGPFPAAILITGSGPQDRDESAFGHQPFLVLADHLARQGIAVLRYDDRGVALSSGKHAGATSADFATDANAAFAWLAARPEIKAQAIGFIGHSEGGMVGLIAARSNPELAYLVLLASPGVPITEMLRTQRLALGQSQGRSVEELSRSEPLQTELLRVAAGELTPQAAAQAVNTLLSTERLAQVGLPPTLRESMRQQVLDPWFRWFVRYDPVPDLQAFQRPLLALNGTLDRQVQAEQNLSGIRRAAAGNRSASVVELPGLNHLFQTAKTGGMGEYERIEETLAPALLDAVARWIHACCPDRATARR